MKKNKKIKDFFSEEEAKMLDMKITKTATILGIIAASSGINNAVQNPPSQHVYHTNDMSSTSHTSHLSHGSHASHGSHGSHGSHKRGGWC